MTVTQSEPESQPQSRQELRRRRLPSTVTPLDDVLALAHDGIAERWLPRLIRRHLPPGDLVLAWEQPTGTGTLIGMLMLAAMCLLGGLSLVALAVTREPRAWPCAWMFLSVGCGSLAVCRFCPRRDERYYFVVTDRRVLIIDERSKGRETVEDIPFPLITGAELIQGPDGFVSNGRVSATVNGDCTLLLALATPEPTTRVVAGLNPSLKKRVPRPEAKPAEERSAGPLSRAVFQVAVLLVRASRPDKPVEWLGEIEAGDAASWTALRRIRFTCGLVRAALALRARDAASPLVRRIDRVALSEKRTRKVTAWTVGAAAFYVASHGGLAALIGNAENLATIGGCVYGAARWRRRTLQESGDGPEM